MTGAGYTGGGAATITAVTIGGVDVFATVLPSTITIANAGTWTGTFVVPMATLGYGTKTVTAIDSSAATASKSFIVTPIGTVESLAAGGMSQLGPGGSAFWSTEVPKQTIQLGGVEIVYTPDMGNLVGVSSASTNAGNATVTVSPLKLPVNYLANAYIKFLTGPAIGLQLIIASNTATIITCTGTFGVAPTAAGGDTFIIVGDPRLYYTNVPPYAIGEQRTGTIVYSNDNQPLWVIWS
jgi:hypothetical protein